jgi:hypothetical protein
MSVLAVLVWTLLGYAVWRAFKTGFDAWVEAWFPGRAGSSPQPPSPARPGKP